MKILVLKKDYFDLIEMRESEIRRLAADPMSDVKLTALVSHGTGGAMFHEGKIIAIIGYYQIWPGAVEVWAFPSIYVKEYAMMYLRTTKRYIRTIEETMNPHRLQTTSFADPLHDRWMKFLGFKNETPEGMKDYSVTKDVFNMWSKTYGR